MQEQWRKIPGFEAYEASSEGKVRPVNPRYSRGRGLVLKPWIVERHGRLAAYVTLCIEKRKHKMLVHRLVALAFHGLPPEGCDDCCHEDHNSLNNSASNLRWDSHSKNIQDNYERRAILEEDCPELARMPFANEGQDADVPF